VLKGINMNFLITTIIFIITTVIVYIFFKNRLEEKTNEIKRREELLSQNILFSRTNEKGIITDASSAFCKLSGYTKEELIGNPHNIVRHPDMPSEVFQDLWETIQKGETWEGEIKNLAKNGHYYWVEANISQEFDTNGNFIGYISIRQEITAQKNFEKQQSIILQEAKMESLSEMIENIAHQWRQPLNTISVSASGLGMKDEMNVLKEGDIQSFTKTVVENTNYLSQTIETFSNFVKKDNKEILTLQDEICGAINIVRTTMDNHNIKLLDDINYEDITTQNIISGELSQVLINIFKNAKDILIEQDKEDKWIIVNLLQSDSKITLTIEDNGGGIPKDIIDKIFEPYFTTRHQYQGKGLGLHLSHKIITESLNGNIYVKNTKNGAKFFIELPIEN
jgi:PAS domain S-box-containing protein